MKAPWTKYKSLLELGKILFLPGLLLTNNIKVISPTKQLILRN